MYKLYLNVIPYNAKYDVMWSSDNPMIATVENGIINAVSLGTTKIRAKCNSKELSAIIKVTANLIEITDIEAQNEVSIYEGDDYLLAVRYLPTNAMNKFLTYTSSNPSVACVSNSGKINGLKTGISTITIMSSNGIKKEVNVIVKNKQPILDPDSNILILLNYTNLELKENETKQLRATILPLDNKKKVIWSSSNDRIATVSENGALIAVEAGTATISAIYDSEHIAKMNLTVVANEVGTLINGVMITEPVEGEITNGFNDKHDGIDIYGEYMTPIKACGKGVVTFSKSTISVGKVIIDHGKGVKTYYYHMEKVYVQVGQEVKQGEIIGDMGDRGGFGIHLHLSLKINGLYYDPGYYLYKK